MARILSDRPAVDRSQFGDQKTAVIVARWLQCWRQELSWIEALVAAEIQYKRHAGASGATGHNGPRGRRDELSGGPQLRRVRAEVARVGGQPPSSSFHALLNTPLLPPSLSLLPAQLSYCSAPCILLAFCPVFGSSSAGCMAKSR